MKFSATGDLHIKPSEVQRVLTGPQSDANRLLRATARQVESSAKLRSPVDTGQLRNSHRTGSTVVQGGVLSTEVEARKNYAAAVHEGSKPRLIRARNKKALRFIGRDGTPVFAKQVTMPARKPRPWLRNALKQAAEPRGFTVTGD